MGQSNTETAATTTLITEVDEMAMMSDATMIQAFN